MKLVPLAFLLPNQRGIVREIRGGRGLVRRLVELGFTPNSEVTIVKSNPGPILVSIKGSRIALGRGVAMKILVEVKN